jgi:hypothetical protein
MPYLQVWTYSTRDVVSVGDKRLGVLDDVGIGFHTGSECSAGNANQYVKLYFLRSAKHIIAKDANNDGQE